MKTLTLENGKKVIRLKLSFYFNESEMIQLVAKNKNLSRKKLLSILKEKTIQFGMSQFAKYDCSLPLKQAKNKLHELMPEMKPELTLCKN